MEKSPVHLARLLLPKRVVEWNVLCDFLYDCVETDCK